MRDDCENFLCFPDELFAFAADVTGHARSSHSFYCISTCHKES